MFLSSLTYRTSLVSINASHRSVKAFRTLSIDPVNCTITGGLICSFLAVKAKTHFFSQVKVFSAEQRVWESQLGLIGLKGRLKQIYCMTKCCVVIVVAGFCSRGNTSFEFNFPRGVKQGSKTKTIPLIISF